jgi:geranylgeranyl reductase family protein
MAARALAAAGFDAVVLEEHQEVGVPVHCTGLVGLDAFRELDIPRSPILAVTHAARFVAADGQDVFIDADRVRAAIIDRPMFDRMLGDSSRSAGAEIRAGHRVRSIRVERDRVRVEVERSAGDATTSAATTVDARACVLACGAAYRFNRALGLGVPRAFVQSAQMEVPFAGPEHIEVHLGRRIAPGGFAWVVPFTRADRPFNRVGLMCQTRADQRFGEFAAALKRRYAVPDDWGAPRLKILPLGPVARTYGDRVVAVGDAAGLVKPTTGGGIYYSLISGAIAADVLGPALAARDLSAGRLREYEARWRARLWPEIRAGLAFRAVTSRLPDAAIAALVELARVDGIVPLLKQTADFNWHRRSAVALLRHKQFRKILLSSMWR